MSTRSPATAATATSVRRRGTQTPRFGSWPQYSRTSGTYAVELAALAGLHLDPWQQFVLEHAMGEQDDGTWSAFEVGVVVPRQNGKGGIIEAALLLDLFASDVELVVYSAHEFKTALQTFNRLKRLIKRTPELARRVPEKNYRNSHGEEGLQVAGGPELRFFARSRGSGRGFTGDKLYFDEAYSLNSDAIAAALPILSAMPNPQVWYLSSAGMHDSTQLTAVRDRGRGGDDADLAYFEWSCAGEGLDLADHDAWAQANPALGIRVTERYIAKERTAFSDDPKWVRERLGVWEDATSGGVISHTEWHALADPPDLDELQQPVPGTGSQLGAGVTPTLAIAVSIDAAWSAIAGAGDRDDDLLHVELADYRRGTSWVVDRCVDLNASHGPLLFALDAGGPARFLITDLLDAGLDLKLATTNDFTDACARAAEAVRDQTWRHRADPVLEQAATGAGKRSIGDRWAWRRNSPMVDISPLEAVTLAAWAAETTAEPDYDLAASIY